MNTRKLRKFLLTLCSALLLVSLSVGITLAYLTDTDTVTNTFTVGKVEIELTEAKVDANGDALDKDGNVVAEAAVVKNGTTEGLATAERVAENEYKLLPGHVYIKDPTVKVVADSADSYVRMIVEVKNYNQLLGVFADTEYVDGDMVLLEKLVGWNKDKWPSEKFTMAEDSESATYEFRYCQMVPAPEEGTTLEPLFTYVQLPGEVVNEKNLANFGTITIDVTAHAIQADGFGEDDDAAWTAFEKQNP